MADAGPTLPSDAVNDIDLAALIVTWERNPGLLGFRDAVLACLRELKNRRASTLITESDFRTIMASAVDCMTADNVTHVVRGLNEVVGNRRAPGEREAHFNAALEATAKVADEFAARIRALKDKAP